MISDHWSARVTHRFSRTPFVFSHINKSRIYTPSRMANQWPFPVSKYKRNLAIPPAWLAPFLRPCYRARNKRQDIFESEFYGYVQGKQVNWGVNGPGWELTPLKRVRLRKLTDMDNGSEDELPLYTQERQSALGMSPAAVGTVGATLWKREHNMLITGE